LSFCKNTKEVLSYFGVKARATVVPSGAFVIVRHCCKRKFSNHQVIARIKIRNRLFLFYLTWVFDFFFFSMCAVKEKKQNQRHSQRVSGELATVWLNQQMTQSEKTTNTTKRHFMGVAWLFGGGTTAPDSAHSPDDDAVAALYTGGHRGGNGGNSNGVGGAGGAASPGASPQRGLEASREDFDVMHGSASLWESTGYQDLKVSIDDACFDNHHRSTAAAFVAAVVGKQGAPMESKKAALTRSHEEFTIVVLTHTQKRFEVAVCLALTVLELKQEIAKHTLVPVERQKLIALTHRLDDDRRLEEYNITANTVVHLVMAIT
jgi:hypothetical protein